MTCSLGFVQNSPRLLRVEENIEGALGLLKGKRADLWVFPEFFATGYRFRSRAEVRSVAEAVPSGKTCRALIAFSKRTRQAVCAGLAERAGGRFYNSSILVDEDRVKIYRKTHLFGIEKKFFSPGNTGFKVHTLRGLRVGMMICFDWFFPESARTLALQGAQVLLHPSNLVLPWGPEAMKVRSLENGVFSVTTNRVGSERGLTFIGQSQIVGPSGEVYHRASAAKMEAFAVRINPAQADRKRVGEANDRFRDRRPGLYY